MYDDPNNKSCLIGLKADDGDDKELQVVNLKNIQENLIDLSFKKLKKKENIV